MAEHQKEQTAVYCGVPAVSGRIKELFDPLGGEVFSVSIFRKPVPFRLVVLKSYLSPRAKKRFAQIAFPPTYQSPINHPFPDL